MGFRVPESSPPMASPEPLDSDLGSSWTFAPSPSHPSLQSASLGTQARSSAVDVQCLVGPMGEYNQQSSLQRAPVDRQPESGMETRWDSFLRHIEGLYSSSGIASAHEPLLPGMREASAGGHVQGQRFGVRNLQDEDSRQSQRGYEGPAPMRPIEATPDLMNLEAPVSVPSAVPALPYQVQHTGPGTVPSAVPALPYPSAVPAWPYQVQHTGPSTCPQQSLSCLFNQPHRTQAVESVSLIDVLSPTAGRSTPFRPCGFDSGQATLEDQPVTPRTPKVGTTLGSGYTPGGTRVLEGPPPMTPPPVPPGVDSETARAVSFNPVTYTLLPPSPIPAPPRPSGADYGQLQFGLQGPEQARSEEPSRLVMQLPPLCDPAEASVITADWLARLGPVMRSLSPGAPGWWSKTIEVATAFYQRWLLADPIQRLAIKTEATSYVWDHGPLARVEERGSILLLQALPQDLQTEAVSTRALGASALVLLTMSRYQPGGTAQKSTILAYLTQPSVEGSPGIVSNHAALRKWERLFRRCRELGLQAPDPSLLVRALDSLGKIINNKSHQAGFRLSSFRHEQQLDVCPTEPKVLHYCQLLTAELETLLLAAQESGKQQRLAACRFLGPRKVGSPRNISTLRYPCQKQSSKAGHMPSLRRRLLCQQLRRDP